jgi:hypothetical protein
MGLAGWTTACSGDFHMSASNLIVEPNPAHEGDVLTATFLLTILPAQQHTMVVIINGTEWTRVVEHGPPAVPTVIQVGAASDLLERYGPGDHQMYVTIDAHSNDGRSRTEMVEFTLAPPPTP